MGRKNKHSAHSGPPAGQAGRVSESGQPTTTNNAKSARFDGWPEMSPLRFRKEKFNMHIGKVSHFAASIPPLLLLTACQMALALPNLTPYQPPTWSDKIVVSKTTGATSDSSSLLTTDTIYVNWAMVNNGTTANSTTFHNTLWVDGVATTVWYYPYSLPAGYYDTVINYSIGSLSAGTHTLKIVLDSADEVVEIYETDNSYTKTITVANPPPPTVSVLPATLATSSSARIWGRIVSDGGSSILERRFDWGPSGTWCVGCFAAGVTVTGSDFYYDLTGLPPNTSYQFRAWARNSSGWASNGPAYFTTSFPPPTVQTLGATSLTVTSAQLNAYIDAHGAIGTFYFQYGATASYGSTTTQGDLGGSAGNGSFTLNGLAPNTTYHYRAVATTTGGTSIGSDTNFTTAICSFSLSSSSTNIGASSGSGGFNLTTTTGCSWTSSTAYSWIHTSSSGSGNGTVNYTFDSNPNASSRSGTIPVGGQTFTINQSGSPGPTVQTQPATLTTANSSQLNGYVNPNGATTTAYFQYGLTTGYGSTTPPGSFGLTPQNIGYTVSGLAPSTTYHYRITAHNNNGTNYGLDGTLTTGTSPASVPPSVTTNPQGQTVGVGASVNFTVGVSGSTPFSYQWRKGGSSLAGKTGATLPLISVTTNDSGGYSVLVTNAYGSALSSVAWLAVYSTSPTSPPPPIVIATNRPPQQPTTVTNTSPQLNVFSSWAFATNGIIDLTKMTIVFTHGWLSQPDAWAKSMASNMVATGVANANLLAWDWHDAANTGPCLSLAFSRTPGEGHKLGSALASVLGTNYAKPIHFIGHSLGTLVNAKAANYLHQQPNGIFSPTKTHITLLDEAEIANIVSGICWDSYVVTGLEQLLGLPEVPTLGWVSPLPDQYNWLDNYISLVGWPHQAAVNVWLNQGIDRANMSNPLSFVQDAHAYAYRWYNSTAYNTNVSILGNRYSFERLGFNSSPAQVCPYPPGSLFVQDTYPAGEFALHEPSLLEFDLLVYRDLSMIATYAFASGLNVLNQIGQTTGDAHVSLDVSAAPVVITAGLTISSTFFYSLQAVLNSASGGQPLLRSSDGRSPQDSSTNTSQPCVWLPVQIPSNAVALSFDFTFTGGAGSDILTTSINGTNLFALDAQFIPQAQRLNSGPISVAPWAGQSVELFFGLVGGTSTNATATVDAMRFYQLAPPSLSIAASSNQVVISWPASAQSYVLESATSLAGTNQWGAVTNAPATNGVWLQVTNSISGSAQYYRLKK